MRSRPTPEHQEAVSRRLALLSAELASVRPPAGERAAPRPVPVPADDEPPEVDETAPPPLPVPGRHASRRSRRLLTAAVPETLRGRVSVGPSQVAVLAVLVALGLAVTCWWVVRGGAHEVVAPVVPSPAAALVSVSPPVPAAGPAEGGATSATAGATTGRAAGSVTVDVAGKVRRPGIAVLDAGARVVDALKAAGGARPGVDLSGLNLARVLVDGEQILVGVQAPVGLAASAAPSAGAPGGPLVNLNTATETELDALPEVGPVTAQAILSWRDEHGGFSSVDELLEVDGIGDATLAKLAPLVTV